MKGIGKTITVILSPLTSRHPPMRQTKAAILSISTLTILMNAAIVPLLSSITSAFPDASSTLIKMSLSLPALTSIVFSLLTGLLARFIPKKYLLAGGLVLYSLGGIGAGFAASIEGFLVLRALLGAGSGVIAPLASDFVADFYDGGQRAKMIGYSNSAANITGIFMPILAASLAVINWRYAFGVYALGLVVLILTWYSIPLRKPAPVTAGSTSADLCFQTRRHGTSFFHLLPGPAFLYDAIQLECFCKSRRHRFTFNRSSGDLDLHIRLDSPQPGFRSYLCQG